MEKNDNKLAKQIDHLKDVRTNLEFFIKDQSKALPKGFNDTRFLQNCMTVLQDTKDIGLVTPVSVARAMLKGAYLGLDFFNKECYAIIYNKNTGTKERPAWIKEVQFQTDYKGETKLAKKYSIRPIKDIFAKLVREGDTFEDSIINGVPIITFKPLPFNDAKIIGAFAVALFDDGSMLYETMSMKEIDGVRKNYSKASTGKAWLNSLGEMCKKTVERRLCKHIELDFESHEQQKTFQAAADVEFTPIDNKQRVAEPQKQLADPFNPEKAKDKPKEKEDVFLKPPSEVKTGENGEIVE